MKVRKLGQPVRLVAFVTMLLMLFGMAAFVSPAAASTTGPGGVLFQTAEQCRDLDANDNLNLEPNELAQLPQSERESVAAFCQANTSIGNGGQKVFVCKFVGTPGVDETLQTGQNPISVSVNAIPDYQGVGSFFADAQGRSLVIAEDNRTGGGQTGEPSAEDCLMALVTPTPTVTVTPTPTVTVTPTEVMKTPVVKTPTEVIKVPTKVVETPKPAAPVTGLPSTGTGSDQSAEIAFAMAGVAALAVIAYGIRKRSDA